MERHFKSIFPNKTFFFPIFLAISFSCHFLFNALYFLSCLFFSENQISSLIIFLLTWTGYVFCLKRVTGTTDIFLPISIRVVHVCTAPWLLLGSADRNLEIQMIENYRKRSHIKNYRKKSYIRLLSANWQQLETLDSIYYQENKKIEFKTHESN